VWGATLDRFFFRVSLDNTTVYYEEIKRELNRMLIYECRCDERLRAKVRDLHVSHTLGCPGDWNT
jgi:hypothetical protein